MGAMQNNPEQGKRSGGKRGSVNNNQRLEAFNRDQRGGGGDWGDCDPALIQAVVVGITLIGGAVTFGLSRNKGAHSLTLLLDDARETLWFNGSADLNECLQEVVNTLAQLD